MLKGKELGAAIRSALQDNGKTPADAARHFGLKPPSISGWMSTGRIGKGNFYDLTKWLSKTPASHWGIDGGHIYEYESLEQEIATILQDDEPQNRSARLKDAHERWAPEAPEAQPSPNERFRPALATSSLLFELSKILGRIGDDDREMAAMALSKLAKKPESYAAVAAHLDLMSGSGNSPAQLERQPKSTNSSGR
jgi:hypothetical protein